MRCSYNDVSVFDPEQYALIDEVTTISKEIELMKAQPSTHDGSLAIQLKTKYRNELAQGLKLELIK